MNHSSNRGFSLLEVIITIGILMTITMGVATMMRGSFDVRFGIAEKGIVDHRLSVVMQKINADLSHAFIIPSLDQVRVGNRKRMTLFSLKANGESHDLRFTALNHDAVLADSKESNQTFIVYRIEQDEKNPGWSHLLRGESKILPEDFRTDPKMIILAKYIKSLQIKAWNGADWAMFDWDSTRSEFRDKLPKMVKVTLEAWDVDPDTSYDELSADKSATVKVQSIIYLPNARFLKETKEPPKTYRYVFE